MATLFDTYVFFANRYVCARCWSQLHVIRQKDGTYYLECSNRENCDGQGYVTKRYAERRRQESIGELMEVKDNYPELWRKKSKPVSEAEFLKSLGY